MSAVEDREQLKSIVSRRLIEAMDETDMTVTRLACLLDVERRDVQRWRNGKVFPAYKIHQLADALGKTVEWMVKPYEDDA